MASAGGEAEEASQVRVCIAWANFWKLAPVLTSRELSKKVKGRAYGVCFHSILGYASETWAIKVEDVARLEYRMMVRYICGRWIFGTALS